MAETGLDLHDVEWTGSKIARFWNQYSGLAAREDAYFSKQVGSSLLRMVRRHGVSLGGNLLDFGCGPGHLLELLAKYGGSYQGVDFSPVSVDAARRRLSGRRGFSGVASVEALPTPLAQAQFDVVFLIETVEHLLPEQREATLREVHRLLRTGGKLVVTVPNEENLAVSSMACPDCGCVFHRMQHVSSWSKASLSSLLSEYGFQTLLCQRTRLASGGVVGAGVNLARLLLRAARPNLVCIARKT
jgi:SAM-dependent methyltransferase